MSDIPTPRTDAELLMDTHPRTVAGGWPSGRKATFGHSHIVAADFARQLERELAEATKQRDALAVALRELMFDCLRFRIEPSDDAYKNAESSLATLEGRAE